MRGQDSEWEGNTYTVWLRYHLPTLIGKVQASFRFILLRRNRSHRQEILTKKNLGYIYVTWHWRIITLRSTRAATTGAAFVFLLVHRPWSAWIMLQINNKISFWFEQLVEANPASDRKETPFNIPLNRHFVMDSNVVASYLFLASCYWILLFLPTVW